MIQNDVGIYLHIPYCVQKCLYCDFATFEKSKIFPIEDYTEILCGEIKARLVNSNSSQSIQTIYFGGGTPSLLSEADFAKILRTIFDSPFSVRNDVEITVEVNPETISAEKLKNLSRLGINRWSVGAQTFSNAQLQNLGRKHSSEQTRKTLGLLAEHGQNFSVDLLYALPNQTLAELEFDLNEILQYFPHHVSPYCLTLKPDHILQKNRPSENIQVEMIEMVHHHLLKQGYEQYEISNYARDGFLSRHNQLYWNFSEYFAFGLSAHGFVQNQKRLVRFWNSRNLADYVQFVQETRQLSWKSPLTHLSQALQETLELHEALSDYCHIRLRTSQGLRKLDFLRFFKLSHWDTIQDRALVSLVRGHLVRQQDETLRLTENGQVLSDQVFLNFTFSKSEVSQAADLTFFSANSL